MLHLYSNHQEMIVSKTQNNIPDCLALCLKVFLEFEAPEYSTEGVEEFRFITEGWKATGTEKTVNGIRFTPISFLPK